MGLLLSLANSARPVAPIVIIAAAVVLFVLEPLSREKAVGKKAVLLAGLLVVYLAGNQLNSWVFTQRIGEAPASVPGFNLLVGFNIETNGSYSSKDSELLTAWNNKEGISAKEVQEAMLDAALERITSGEVDFLPLFYEKISTLWSGDDAPVGYGDDALPHLNLLIAGCNGYHYFLWLLALGAMAALLREKGKSLFYLFPLYLVGLTMAHLIAEVAQRYHYSGNFCLAVLAAYGVYRVGLGSLRQARAARKGGETSL